MKRVVVTGIGITSCFGDDHNEFYDQLLAGKSGVRPIDAFDVSEFPTRFAGAVKDFDCDGYLDRKQARRVDPFMRFGVFAGKRALEDAGFDWREEMSIDPKRAGILIGSGMGGMKVFYDGVETILQKGFKRLTPFFIPHIISNMAGGLLGIELGFQGPNYSVSTACATANYAIVNAANHIRMGDADLMICGGVESAINPIGLAGFVACKALSTRNDDPEKASRPWDKNRDGFVMGDGGGVLILESEEHALKRGARIYAEYLGGALGCDAYHMTDPRPNGEGVSHCINLALQNAGIEREQINYVNAHATSTLVGDMCEVRAIHKSFGSHAKNLKMNATKSLTGHCLGAAAGIEAVATIKAIERGELHPTANLEEPEEELGEIDVLADGPKKLEISAAISNSFGFGGHNSSIILAPYKS